MLWLTVMFFGLSLSASRLWGQSPPEEGIQAGGTAEIALRPEQMRMSVDLISKGKDVAEAIEKLRGVRAKAEGELAKLGAIKESVKFGDPQVDESEVQRREQMEAMLRSRLTPKRAGGKPPVIAAPVTVTLPLEAAFPLTAADASELLIEVTKLQSRIKAVDLAAAKSAAEPTPEEAELSEEMEQMQQQFEERGGRKPGTPTFSYAATVLKEQREKAIAEAFQMAREEAERLSRATATELGPIRSLGASSQMGLGDADEYGGNYYYQARMAAMLRQQGGKERNEVVGPSPQSLRLQVHVQVTYRIGTK